MGWHSFGIYRKNHGVNFSGDPMEKNNECALTGDQRNYVPMIELDDILGIQWQLLQQIQYDVFIKVLMIKQTVQQDKNNITLLINSTHENTLNINKTSFAGCPDSSKQYGAKLLSERSWVRIPGPTISPVFSPYTGDVDSGWRLINRVRACNWHYACTSRQWHTQGFGRKKV